MQTSLYQLINEGTRLKVWKNYSTLHFLLNKDLHMQVHEVCFIVLHVLCTMVYFSSLVF